MAAVWLRARTELRGRWRSSLALALLIGIGAGAAMTAAAGARRTDTAYPRFLRAHGGADLLASAVVGGESFLDGRVLSLDDFARMPAVEQAQMLRFYLIRNPFAPESDEDAAFMAVDARSPQHVGRPLDRYKILEGRAPDPARADEAVVTLVGAAKPGLRVGARFDLRGVAEVFPDFAGAVDRKPLRIHIVGRVAAPGDFPPQSGDETVALHMTPAFYERYPELAFGFPGGAVLGLDDGPAAADRFRAGYAAAGGNPGFTVERAQQDANVQRSFHLQAVALWLLALLAAVAFVLVFGQTLARQMFIESGDHATLWAVGLTRSQQAAALLMRALLASVAGAFFAVALSTVLSPVLPTGLAAVAEPHPGFRFDAAVAGAGAAGIVAVVVLLGVWPAWRSARARRADALAPERGSVVAEMLARAGRLPALVAGARLALQRGRGRAAVPVRSSILSVTLGIVVLAATATFASSLDHFLDTPQLYGVTWDARVGVEPPEQFSGGERSIAATVDIETIARMLSATDRRVLGVAIGRTGFNLSIGGRLLEAVMIEPVGAAAPLPPLLEGRYPRQRPAGQMQEIALGRGASDRLGISAGDTVEVEFLDVGAQQRTVLVTGIAVVPVFVDSSRLGDSVMLPLGLLQNGLGVPADVEEAQPSDLFLSVTDPGSAFVVGGDSVLERIAEIAGPSLRAGNEVHVWPDRPPSDVVNFGRMQSMPLVLGLLLALFAAATLAHTLVSAGNRRRRDLAILKTLGFVRGQVRRAVQAQALILTCLALAVGVPAGIATGRWVWRAFARDLGIVPEPIIDAATVAGGVAGILLIAAIIAVLPGHRAAATQPAAVLRAE